LIKNVIIIAFAAVLAAGNHHPIYAGECPYPEEYVVALEEGPNSTLFEYAIGCLVGSHIEQGKLWAGPNTAAAFAEMRADPYQPRIVKAASALLSSSWADVGDHRQKLFRIVARRGVAQLDSTDVFVMLLTSTPQFYRGIYEEMAILRDCRAVDVLRTRYGELRTNPERGFADEILDLLNCLYHIPCNEAVLAAEQFLSEEKDQKLRERIQRVVDR
jgi:hypothetical protein